MDNVFAQVPTDQESMVALVMREAEEEWHEEHLRWWERLDGTLPDPAVFADLPGGACGTRE